MTIDEIERQEWDWDIQSALRNLQSSTWEELSQWLQTEKQRKKKLPKKHGIEIVTEEWVTLYSEVSAKDLWLPDFRQFNHLLKADREKRILKAVETMIEAGMFRELYMWLTGINEEHHIKSLNEVKIWWKLYNRLNADSKRIVIMHHLRKAFSKVYNPIYIEISSKEADKLWLTKESLEENKKRKITYPKRNKWKEIVIETIDLDTAKWYEWWISWYKKHLCNEFIERKITQIWEKLRRYEWSRYAINSLWNTYWLDKLIIEYFNLVCWFNHRDQNAVKAVMEFIWKNLNKADKKFLKTICEQFWLKESDIDDLFWKETSSFISWRNEIASESIKEWWMIESISEENEELLWFSLFTREFNNWDIIDLWLSKVSSFYNTKFKGIIEQLIKSFNWIEFHHYWMITLSKNDINLFNKITWLTTTDSKNDNSYTTQMITQFELPENIDDEDIINIWNLVKQLFPEIETNSNIEYQPFMNGYINTIDPEWDLEFRWFFSLGKWVEWNNLLVIRNKNNWKKYLHVWISEFSLDKITYINSQISYYLSKNWWSTKNKNRKFINPSQLYTNMYYQYNLTYLSWQKLYPIEIMKEQYEQFIQYVIAPLSKQRYYKNWDFWKALNTLLIWVQWTSKSQFLLHLLMLRKFIYEWEELELNATVVPLNILEFVDALKSDFWDIRQKLVKIYDNTKAPIIVAVEDLDTYIFNKWNWDPGIEQLLTTFFEWVWSLPITLISSTNKPWEFPWRLLRENRFSNLINYPLPLSKEQIINIFETHIVNLWLQEIFTEELKNIYLPKMWYFTPSHIYWFVNKVYMLIQFKNLFKKSDKIRITKDDIENIFKDLNINTQELERTQDQINKWLEQLKNQEKTKMWFQAG